MRWARQGSTRRTSRIRTEELVSLCLEIIRDAHAAELPVLLSQRPRRRKYHHNARRSSSSTGNTPATTIRCSIWRRSWRTMNSVTHTPSALLDAYFEGSGGAMAVTARRTAAPLPGALLPVDGVAAGQLGESRCGALPAVWLPAVPEFAQLEKHGACIGAVAQLRKLLGQSCDDRRALQPKEGVDLALLAIVVTSASSGSWFS